MWLICHCLIHAACSAEQEKLKFLSAAEFMPLLLFLLYISVDGALGHEAVMFLKLIGCLVVGVKVTVTCLCGS